MNKRSRKIPGLFWLIAIMGLMILHLGSQKASAENMTAVEGLKRVGPVDPTYGYPLWYEAKNGLKLGLCIDPVNCFIEIPDPTRPLFMAPTSDDPTMNFPDEVFFYAAESIFAGEKKGVRAVLVQTLEGMFFSDAGVIPDDQAVMARIRIRIDGLTEGETYTVVYPYGIETFLIGDDCGPGCAKGPGISMTRDIGLTGPGEFKGPIKGDIGPFLIPVGSPSAADFSPGQFVGNGGATEVHVTGSPLAILTGRNTNVFRIEGRGIGGEGGVYDNPLLACADLTPFGPDLDGTGKLNASDCVESYDFSVMGQAAQRFGVRVDRATYSKVNDVTTGGLDEIFVNVWASTIEGQTLVATVDGGEALNLTEGVDGNYFGRLSVPPGTIPASVSVTNASDNPPFSESMKITDEVIIRDTTYTVTTDGSGIVSGTLSITAESSNRTDKPPLKAYLFRSQESRVPGAVIPTSFDLVYGGDGLAHREYLLSEGPVYGVMVKSESIETGGGASEEEVVVTGTNTGNVAGSLLAVAGPPMTIIADGQTVELNGAASIGPLGMTYNWTYNDPTGQITALTNNVGSSVATFVAPTAVAPLVDGKLIVDFTLTVNDPDGNQSTAIKTVTMIQPNRLPSDTCGVFSASYRADKQRWAITGYCDLAANQMITVFVGTDAAARQEIGSAFLMGNTWTVDNGNGSATDVQAPIITGATPDTKIHVQSTKGFNGTFKFVLE